MILLIAGEADYYELPPVDLVPVHRPAAREPAQESLTPYRHAGGAGGETPGGDER